MLETPGARRDPRIYQILVLSTLLVFGALWLDLGIRPGIAGLLLTAALATQLGFSRLYARVPFDPRSALISGLSLCLLVRTGSWPLAALTAFLAIASKFLVRLHGKHLFNPTNFAIVAVLLSTSGVWVSPGQWGSAAFLAFLLACLGGLVVNRAGRSDVSLAFACSYASILFGRALWLGQPTAIPLHQLTSGALLIFTFFMISDPKTTPDSRAGRLVFGLLVALGAGFVQFVLFRPNALLLSLAFLSPVVPLLDLLLPGSRYSWRQRSAAPARLAASPT